MALLSGRYQGGAQDVPAHSLDLDALEYLIIYNLDGLKLRFLKGYTGVDVYEDGPPNYHLSVSGAAGY